MDFSYYVLLLTAMLLIQTTCAISPLRVVNHLRGGPLTVLNPPGCCSPCGPDDPTIVCPAMCVPCRNVTVAAHSEGRLDTRTPYPMPYMMIQAQDAVWCVRSSDLALLTDSVALVVGPGACGPGNAALQAYTFSTREGRPRRFRYLCLDACDPYVIGARQP